MGMRRGTILLVAVLVLVLAVVFERQVRRAVAHAFKPLLMRARQDGLAADMPLVHAAIAEVAASTPPGRRLAILDFGAGFGTLTNSMEASFPIADVVPIDVDDDIYLHTTPLVVYDGKRLPFADGAFDVAVIGFVLHHTSEPVALLAEVARVARRVVLLEDVPQSPSEQLRVKAMDSLLNWEFRNHPHANLSHTEWKDAFGRCGLTCIYDVKLDGSLMGRVMCNRGFVLDSTATVSPRAPGLSPGLSDSTSPWSSLSA